MTLGLSPIEPPDKVEPAQAYYPKAKLSRLGTYFFRPLTQRQVQEPRHRRSIWYTPVRKVLAQRKVL